jgi:uncharacterized protein YndB with AHSA1/START domain
MATQNLIISHHFAAPPQHVWQAWTDPALVRQWWGPDHFSCPIAVMDVRLGGKSLLCMRAPASFGGRDTYSTFTYTELVPHTRMCYLHTLADAQGEPIDPASIGMPADFPQGQLHELDFISQADGSTRLIVTEHNWTVGQMMELSRMGMEQCLKKMAVALGG